MEADYQDEQHGIALNTGWCKPHNDRESSRFLWTRYVTSQVSNSGYTHPLCAPCLCDDKGSNLG